MVAKPVFFFKDFYLQWSQFRTENTELQVLTRLSYGSIFLFFILVNFWKIQL